MACSVSTGYTNVAQIIKPHAVKGEVVVKPIDGLPFVLFEGQRVCLTPPRLNLNRWQTIESINETAKGIIMRLAEVKNLNVASGISGSLILVKNEDLPDIQRGEEPLNLLGRQVVDVKRGELGEVTEYITTPANDVIEVKGRFGSVLIPIIDQVVVDIPLSGSIVVSLLPGLLDDEDK